MDKMKIVVTSAANTEFCRCQLCNKTIAELKNDIMIPSPEECYKNGNVPGKLVFKVANMNKETEELLITSAEKLKLSARAYHRVIRLARTIADIERSENVEKEHVLEALHYRPKIN